MKQVLTIFLAFKLFCSLAQSPVLIIPKGHTAEITSLCFSSDGKRILSGSRDYTAKVWDLSAHELQTFILTNEVQAVAFSPGGDSILTGNTDRMINLWKISGENLLMIPKDNNVNTIGHKNAINSLAYSSNGKNILSASKDGSAMLWSPDGKLFQTFKHAKSISSAVFSRDGKSILTGSEDKTAILWRPAGKKIQTFTGHNGSVLQVRISADGKYFLTVSSDHTAILWDQNGKKIQQVQHADIVYAGDIASDNQTIATAGMDGIVKIWNVKGEQINSFKAHQGKISTLCFAPDGKSFITAGEDADIRQWNLKGDLLQSFMGHANAVNSVSLSADGTAIIAAYADNCTRLWDISNNHFRNLTSHNNNINTASISSNGNTGFSGGEDKSLKIVQRNGSILHNLALSGSVKSVQISPDGQYILAACYTGGARLIDTSGKLIRTFNPKQVLNCAIFSTNGQIIATGSDDGFIQIYDLQAKLLNTINVESKINKLVFSPDNSKILSASYNGFTRVWDVNSGNSLNDLEGPGEEIWSIDISPDGNHVASGNDKGILKLMNTSGNDIKLLPGHTSRITSVQYSKNNKWLISSSLDGTIKLWDASNGNEILTMVSLDSTDWVVSGKDGLFDASAGAMRLLYYKTGTEILELDQLKDRFYEPGLLGAKLGITKQALRDVTGLQKVSLYPEMKASITKSILSIQLIIREGGLGGLNLLINNKEVEENLNPEKKLNLSIDLNNYNKYFYKDSNIISLRVYNEKGWLKSQLIELPYILSGAKGDDDPNHQNPPVIFTGRPNLYAVVVGTSDYAGTKLDLKFPDKDAAAIADAVKKVGSRLFGSDAIHVTLLTTMSSNPSEISSKLNIKAAFDSIATNSKAGDVLLAYFSGHGSTFGEAENNQFYYLTKDFSSDDLSDPVIRKSYTISSNDLTSWLTHIPSRKQVLIFDACHSGKVVDALADLGARDLNPSQIRALDRMKDRAGVYILTGSASDKVSYEASQFGQGLLTYSLLQGISGLALTPDKRVDVATLFQYSREKVPELAIGINKIQVPIIAYPKGGGSFDIGLVDTVMNFKISQPKPVFIRNNFQNETTFSDSIGITNALADYFNAITAKGADADLVYVDVNEYENAYSIKGLYSVKDNTIQIRGALFQGKSSVGEFQLSGSLRSIPELVELIISKVGTLIKK